MPGLSRCCFVALALTAVLGSLLSPAPPHSHADEPLKAVRIGLPGSMFRDLPQAALPILAQPFTQMLQEQTGMKGQFKIYATGAELGEQLEQGKIQLGVFSGIEFAWAREHCATMVPLVIAVNTHRLQRALVVCRADSKAASFADLKGTRLDLPFYTREHCHVVLQACCAKEGAKPAEFFAQVARPANLELALDDVVTGKAEATVVDCVALEWYKKQKPGCFAWLKVVEESEDFPAGVIAYHPCGLDKADAQRVAHALTNAQKTAQGKELLTTLRMTAFEPVPDDYEQVLTHIAKCYPAPGSCK